MTPTDSDCKTRYPILLIHGAGFRDLKWPVYWGRIPGILEGRGAALYYGNQDCWASVETNAAALTARIDEVLAETGAEKVNLIAHSKGGLEARMAASSLGYGPKIASITTVATPHHGSRTLDRLCLEFNRENPDVPGVFYQSYACVMSHPFSDINLSTANFILNRIEGPNDGLVSVASASWGENVHVLRSAVFRGISHLDAIDLRRSPFTRKGGQGVADICEVYVQIVRGLKDRGF